MINYYSERIFDPMFTYRLASQCVGEWEELESFLMMTGGLLSEEESHVPFALQTNYYRYTPFIAVLFEKDAVFYCQTFANGMPDKLFDVLQETDALIAYFETNQGEFTVFDVDRVCMLVPDAETVLTYVRGFTQAREINDKHDQTLKTYAKKVEALRKECDELYKKDLDNPFKKGLTLAEHYYFTLRQINDEICEKALSKTRRCVITDENALPQMFGLFVQAMYLGLARGRFLSRQKRVLATSFGNMLKEMHLYMSIHKDILEKYADYLQLHANEREKLQALLREEGLFDEHWGMIGDDLFS